MPSCYRRLQLPVNTRDKNTFCWPIKVQSQFDNQTSKFTRPLGKVLAPLTQMIEADLSTVWQLKTRRLQDHSRYPTEIPLLNYCVDCNFQNYKKTKYPYALLTLHLFRGLRKWRQNVPNWAGKLWSLTRRENFNKRQKEIINRQFKNPISLNLVLGLWLIKKFPKV